MAERPDNRQLHLSIRTQRDARSKEVNASKKNRPVTHLGSVRALRHGATVLERVIREGFIKKKW
jgi:hypothetical protein